MKILLVQTSFLGDTILSTPVISGIKKIYPDAELWVMTTPLAVSLVERDPLIEGVISYDKRVENKGLSGLLRMKNRIKNMGFDMVYSLHRSFRTSLLLWLARIPDRIGCSDAKLRFLYTRTRPRNFNEHDVLRNLSILSGDQPVEAFDAEMRLFPPEEKELKEELKRTLPQAGSYAVLAPGSVWKTKMWHRQGFRSVARYLLAQGIHVVLIGAKSDKAVCAEVAQGLDVIDLSGKTGISEVLYVMKQAAVVICNDSMSLHMASAFKIPSVAVFCATSPEFGYGPWKNKAIVVEKEGLACKPCRPHGSNTCPTGTEACMRDLPAETVIDAVKNLLEIQ